MRENCISIVNDKKFQENYIKNKYPDIYRDILMFNKNLDISWLNKLYNYIYDIKTNPVCLYCNKPLEFKNKISTGYGIYCSKKCTSLATRKKVKETNLKKYGVEYPLQNEEIYEKLVKTNLKKYGVVSTLSDENVKEKIIKTNLKKYGVENPSKSNTIKNIRKQTILKKYGVENIFQNENIKQKISKKIKNKSKLEKDLIKEKIKQTNLKKYDVSTVLVLNENRKKLINYNLMTFGVEYPLQNLEIRNKVKNTILNKYGVENISKLDFLKSIKKYNIIIKWAEILKIPTENIKYNNNIFTITNYCEAHNNFKIKYDDLYNRIKYGISNICTKCNPINKQSSIKENEIAEFLTSLGIEYIKRDRKTLSGFEIDFNISNYKLGIEFNGLYWHSDRYTINNYHLNKTELCEKQGIQLLHIFEDEWIYKKEIVKSIIRSKLGVVKNKIFARKCVVKEINSITSNNFLNDNHLQGKINSKIKLGLFYNDELVSLMTFGKKRIAMGNKQQIDGEYEMLRFCNKLNTKVIGGASKLLNYFIKIYQPKSIISFADRRYSNGELYEKLGFKFLYNTKPNYWYFKKNELIRYHRFEFRKDILVKLGYDKNNTEKQIMFERGYLRIYDCGNMKYEYKI